MPAESYAQKIEEQLGEAWLARIYRERILKLRTRSYHFENARPAARVDVRRGNRAPVLPEEGQVGRESATKGKQQSDLNAHLVKGIRGEEVAPLRSFRRGVLGLDHVPFELDMTPA